MSKPKLLLVLCGDTFPAIREQHGNFDHWFIQAMERPEMEIVVWNAHQHHDVPDISFIGAVLTGSPAMVTDRAGWSEALSGWVLECIGLGIPVLGVCYGHQLLADALGGEVDFQPGGREIGSLLISCSSAAADDPLFSKLPQSFFAQLTHAQSVTKMPTGAVLLGSSSRVGCQAFRYGEAVWGVQFHPEFSRDVMAAYINIYSGDMSQRQRLTVEEHLHDSPEANQLLGHFVDYCLTSESSG
ncbi:GMP synthase [Hahella sp. CCB-MM4]|uniref:glutamine amidotransferase n=1 Tax=Hahella sp. (strain CCB-MM4) TaxID=1926491 RepID=UPI000B9B65B9|nr:glutamine amidotransferase [Hahella sp. CCB-MM4]OZG73891.1 GMP synthase [Hahella sp. CCB-MM4]